MTAGSGGGRKEAEEEGGIRQEKKKICRRRDRFDSTFAKAPTRLSISVDRSSQEINKAVQKVGKIYESGDLRHRRCTPARIHISICEEKNGIADRRRDVD